MTNFNQPMTLKQVYYSKLAMALASDGYQADLKLLETDHPIHDFPTTDTVLPIPVGVGPNIGYLDKLKLQWQKVSGTKIRHIIEDISPMFTYIAAKYEVKYILFATVIEADSLHIKEAQARAETLLKVFRKLSGNSGINIGVNCLYMFFNQKRGQQLASSICAKCYKKYTPWFGSSGTVYIWPIVVNVPVRTIKYPKGLSVEWYKATGAIPGKTILSQAFLR